MKMNYDDFFRKAMGLARDKGPYHYQRNIANEPELPELIRVPTSAGKTAAIILGWLWRRHFAKPGVRRATPRRLVYCLPMRVLVEQSVREATRWLANLDIDDIEISVLMGGVDARKWFLHPERSAILIGTQDMLLSRALNRGYGASRFHWPIDFGLLSNDSLWVFDEPQLMGSGVSTSAQLAGLRTALGTFGPSASLWMSATLEPDWLDTIDFAGRSRGPCLELSANDYDPALPLYKRMTALKALHALGTSFKDGKDVARQVITHHQEGTQTLVVLNTVERAKAVYDAIKKAKDSPEDVLLVHSRFRPAERERLNESLIQPGTNRIVVATQVVEAGVDLSARTLVTELAPWASLVQRFGRCNRTGDDGPGRIFWIDLDDKHAAPYEADVLEFAREQLTRLEGQNVSPKALDEYKREQSITLRFAHTHVLRRRDLLDLFDTTSDLSGNDIDVSRFVRGESEESDVQVFWRELGASGPGADKARPNRRELCHVPIGQLKAFLEKERNGKRPTAYVWDQLNDAWRRIRDPRREVYPGLSILLPAATGGYSVEVGWSPESQLAVVPVVLDSHESSEAIGSDPNSSGPGPALTITEHTRNVGDHLTAILSRERNGGDELATLLRDCGDSPSDWPDLLRSAARWHDVGKAHSAFQSGILAANTTLDATKLWAKSGLTIPLKHGRRFFRHELASALAALQQLLPFEVVYLIAAHHGRVRLSIRTLPDEEPPRGEDRPFALGVHHGDGLPAVDLGGETSPELTLDLSPMQLGDEASWTARALALRETLGPFRLAYLEALLRAADRRASAAERTGDQP